MPSFDLEDQQLMKWWHVLLHFLFCASLAHSLYSSSCSIRSERTRHHLPNAVMLSSSFVSLSLLQKKTDVTHSVSYTISQHKKEEMVREKKKKVQR